MKKMYIYLVLAVLLCSSFVSAYRIIQVTTNSYKGNLSGLAGADNICNSTFGSDYKALLGLPGVRDKNSPNWVLANNTEYRRIDNTTIGTTGVSDACLTLNLSNSVSLVTGTAWTGLRGNCTAKSDNCNGWTSNYFVMPMGPGYKGGSGTTNSITGTWLDKGYFSPNPSTGVDPCSGLLKLYCVSQTDLGGPEKTIPEVNKSNQMLNAVLIIIIALAAGMMLFKKK